LTARDAEHQKRVASLLAARDAEHQKRVASLLAARDAEHQKRVESLLTACEEEYKERVESLLFSRDAECQETIKSLLSARDEEHQKRVELLLYDRDYEHQKTVESLLSTRDAEHKKTLQALLSERDAKHKKITADFNEKLKYYKYEIRRLTRNADADVRSLQAEIKTIRRSLSWKLTAPLRSLSQKYPNAGIFTVRLYKEVVKLFFLPTHGKKRDLVSDQLINDYAVSENFYKRIQQYSRYPMISKRKIVLYTAIFGDYDNLLLPEGIDKSIDYICFTDRPRNTYGVWQFRASPYYDNDPTRIARFIKTHPHELFSEYEYAIWCDANIILRSNPKKYIIKLKQEKLKLGLVPHPHRNCFYEEAEACKKRRKDDPSVINKQVEFYKNSGFKENLGMFETGFFVVRLTDDNVLYMFQLWWEQIAKFSRRDQLGVMWAVIHAKITICHLLPKGVTVREDPDFLYVSHDHSRELCTPNRLIACGQLESPFDEVKYESVKNARLSKLKETSIDIIVCVYNALDDVRLCLESVHRYLLPNHNIIIINDKSNEETSDFLHNFSLSDDRIKLIENKQNMGYVRSANRGLAAANADFLVLLNSDTVVCENWALKLLDTAMTHKKIGIVGPLSNAAGVQSIPEIKCSKTNTAINVIPNGVSYTDIDRYLEKISLANSSALVMLVHGFCFGIKREVIDKIGFFDEVNFARYYGEENDFCFRASLAGFQLAIATNTFVFHRKSRSIDEEERIIHMKKAGARLREIYSTEVIRKACLQGEDHTLLKFIRTKVKNYLRET
jgi:GT2 family glycosyltransferase